MNCHSSLLPSGDNTIQWIAQHVRTEWLTPKMLAITNLGSVMPILLIMSLAYWCWNKSHAKTLIYGILSSALINIWLKGLIAECRPPKIYHLQPLTDLSYSFPSGHAQVTTIMWVGLAYYARSKILSALFILIALLISFSRNYLGVHYVHDVIAGIVIGLIILWLTLFNERKQLFQSLPNWTQLLIILALIIYGQSTIHHDTKALFISLYFLLGTWIGSYLEAKHVKFTPAKQLSKMIPYVLYGLGGIFVLSYGLNALTEKYMLTNLYLVLPFQYILIGIWIMYGTPRISS